MKKPVTGLKRGKMKQVGIILGSDSDLPEIKGCFEIFDRFNISYEVLVSSAHRTPEKTSEWVKGAAGRGLKVIIAAAGGAAHLPGVVAAYTLLPVIGIPVESGIVGGLDSLLSISQMPAGIPVAAMAAGRAGGTNAALFAANILALSDASVAEKLSSYRKEMEKKILEKNEMIDQAGLMNYIKMLEGKNDRK
jgi:5-(carboxyamino)imidazole ribonucleotide mutase